MRYGFMQSTRSVQGKRSRTLERFGEFFINLKAEYSFGVFQT